MRRFFTITRLLLLVQLRNKAVLFWSFAFPIGLIVLYGAIYGAQDFGPVSAITWLLPGVIALNIMASGFIGEAGWLTDQRERGVLQRVRATPLPPVQLVGSYVLVRLLLLLVQSVLITLVAMVAYGVRLSWGELGVAFGVMLLGGAIFIALGQAIAAIAPSSGAGVVIGQALYFPLMFVSNLFAPISFMPAWIQEAAPWTPAFMLVDLLRPAMVPAESISATWFNLLGLTLYGLLGLTLAVRFFRWSPVRHA